MPSTSCTTAKLSNLKLKTWPKQLLYYLQLAFLIFEHVLATMSQQGAQKLTGDNLKVVWTAFSYLRYAVFVVSSIAWNVKHVHI